MDDIIGPIYLYPRVRCWVTEAYCIMSTSNEPNLLETIIEMEQPRCERERGSGQKGEHEPSGGTDSADSTDSESEPDEGVRFGPVVGDMDPSELSVPIPPAPDGDERVDKTRISHVYVDRDESGTVYAEVPDDWPQDISWPDTDISEHFPFDSPRPAQRVILPLILEALERHDTVICQIPPGVGKSAIAMALASRESNTFGRPSYILTPSINLQEQYGHDFGACAKVLKGRGNFRCLSDEICSEHCVHYTAYDKKKHLGRSYTKCDRVSNSALMCRVCNAPCSDAHGSGFKRGQICPHLPSIARVLASCTLHSGHCESSDWRGHGRPEYGGCVEYDYTGECGYYRARYDALRSPIALSNYAFVSASLTHNSANFQRRYLTVADECHNIESLMLSSLHWTLKDDEVKIKTYQLVSLEKLDVDYESGRKASTDSGGNTAELWEVTNPNAELYGLLRATELISRWTVLCASSILEFLDEHDVNDEQLRGIAEVASSASGPDGEQLVFGLDENHPVSGVISSSIRASRPREFESDTDILSTYGPYIADEMVTRMVRYLSKGVDEFKVFYSGEDSWHTSVKTLLDAYVCDPGFVVELYVTKRTFPRSGEETRVRFRPLYMDQLAQRCVFDASEKWLMMSGFIPDVDKYAECLGLRDYCVISMEYCPFPAHNRKIHVIPQGYMTSKYRDKTMLDVVKVIAKLISEHEGTKGVILPSTYYLNDELVDRLRATPSIGFERIITHHADDHTFDRDKRIRAFMDDTSGRWLSSVTAVEGSDFKGDMCRILIIPAVPQCNRHDRVTQIRADEDDDWDKMQVVSRLLQGTFRGVRSDTDSCYICILDKYLLYLIEEYEHLFPQYFLDAVKMHGPCILDTYRVDLAGKYPRMRRRRNESDSKVFEFDF